MASEADGNESHAQRAEQLWDPVGQVWRVGREAHQSSPYIMLLVFYTCSMEACYQKLERKEKEMNKNQRGRDTHRHRERQTTTTMDRKIFPKM
jgi:ERCC4-related helicase